MNNLKAKEHSPLQKSFVLKEGTYTLGSAENSSIKFSADVFDSEDVLSITITGDNSVFIGALSHQKKLLINDVLMLKREVKQLLAGDNVLILGTCYALSFSAIHGDHEVQFVFSKGDLNDHSLISLVPKSDESIDEDILKKQSELAELEKNIEEIKEEVTRLEENVVSKTNKALELDSVCNKAISEKDDLDIQIIESHEKLEEISSSLSAATESLDLISKQIDTSENMFQIHKKQNEASYHSFVSKQIAVRHNLSLAKERLIRRHTDLLLVEGKQEKILNEIQNLSKDKDELSLLNNQALEVIEEKNEEISKLDNKIEELSAESERYSNLIEDKEKALASLHEKQVKLTVENEVCIENNRINYEKYLQDFEKLKLDKNKALEVELDNKMSTYQQKIKEEEIEIRNKFQSLREKHFEEIQKSTTEANIINAELVENAKIEADAIRQRNTKELKESEAKADLLFQKRERELKEKASSLEEKDHHLNSDIEAKRAETVKVLDKAHEFLELKRKEANELMNKTEEKCFKKIEDVNAEIALKLSESVREISAIERRNEKTKLLFNESINAEKEKLKEYLKYRRNKNMLYIEKLNEKHAKQLHGLRERELTILENEKRKVLKSMLNLKHDYEFRYKSREITQKEELKELKKQQLKEIDKVKKNLMAQVKGLEVKKSDLISQFENEQKQKFEKLKDLEMAKFDEARRAYEGKLAIAVEGRILEIEDRNLKRVGHAASCVYQVLLKHFPDVVDSSTKTKNIIEKEIVKSIDDALNSNDVKADALSDVRVSRDNIKGFEAHFKKHGLKAATAFALAVIVVANPYGVKTNFVNGINKILQDHVEITAKVQNKNLVDLTSEREFKPKLDKAYKTNYTDNILYTKDFYSIYNNESFQNEWVLGLYEYVVNELELPEEFAVEYVSSEGTLIRELQNIRSEIDNRFLNLSIKKMRKLEQEFLNKTIEEVDGLENWNKILKFKKNFFLKHRNIK